MGMCTICRPCMYATLAYMCIHDPGRWVVRAAQAPSQAPADCQRLAAPTPTRTRRRAGRRCGAVRPAARCAPGHERKATCSQEGWPEAAAGAVPRGRSLLAQPAMRPRVLPSEQREGFDHHAWGATDEFVWATQAVQYQARSRLVPSLRWLCRAAHEPGAHARILIGAPPKRA
eukprot:scaffold44_cov411-Prasinococcus_capsulatus_cf.AAC.7